MLRALPRAFSSSSPLRSSPIQKAFRLQQTPAPLCMRDVRHQQTRSNTAHAISNPTLAGIEKRWEDMPPQEQLVCLLIMMAIMCWTSSPPLSLASRHPYLKHQNTRHFSEILGLQSTNDLIADVSIHSILDRFRSTRSPRPIASRGRLGCLQRNGRRHCRGHGFIHNHTDVRSSTAQNNE